MSRKQITDNISQYPRAIKCGFLTAPLLPILLLILALAVSKGWLRQGREELGIFICVFITAFVAGRVGTRHAKSNRICYSLCGEVGLVVFILLLGLFTKESPFFNMLLLWVLIIVLFGAFLSATLMIRNARVVKKKSRYNR